MQTIPFGATGLRTSVAGLGCGGHSRLGAGGGADDDAVTGVVRHALDHGVTFVDTSPSYENEALVGRAVAPVRDQVVLSTKFSTLNRPGAAIDAAGLRRSLEASLTRLGTDRVEVLAVQSVTTDTYGHCVDELLPELHRLRDEGMVRAFGLTEWFFDDTTHRMAEQAVRDGLWDYLLVGFNLLNQTGAERVLGPAAAAGTATAVMFAVRKVLADPELLRRFVGALVAAGELDAAAVDPKDPLGFVFAESDCSTLTEAAYRFCRHASAGAVVLTGTGSTRHLDENLSAIEKGPLPEVVTARLRSVFGRLDGVTGQEIVDADGRLERRLVAGKPRGH